MEQMAFDEKVAAQLDAFYRTRDVIRRRDLALAALDAQPADVVVQVPSSEGIAALGSSVGAVGVVDALLR